MGAQGGGKVSPGGETEYADAMRVDVPLGGTGADEAEGALGILKRGGGFGIRTGIGHAVFDQDAVDAGGVQPIADFGAFEIDGQDAVSAAGKHQDGRAGVVALGRNRR